MIMNKKANPVSKVLPKVDAAPPTASGEVK